MTEKNDAKWRKQKRLFVDMDGTLTKFNPEATMNDLLADGYFRELPPEEAVVEAVRRLIRYYPEVNVYVLSACLTGDRFISAAKEKTNWLKQYVPELSLCREIFIPCGRDKSELAPGIIGDKDFLLDDYTKNLVAWESHDEGQGHPHGIKLLNGINATHGTWKGNQIRADRDPAEISALISNIMHNGLIVRQIPYRTRLTERVSEESAVYHRSR